MSLAQPGMLATPGAAPPGEDDSVTYLCDDGSTLLVRAGPELARARQPAPDQAHTWTMDWPAPVDCQVVS